VIKMIIRFKNEEEYQQWLKWQSANIREKGKRFFERYGNVIPIVLVIDAYTPQGGEWAPAYIFVHPSQGEELLNWIVE